MINFSGPSSTGGRQFLSSFPLLPLTLFHLLSCYESLSLSLIDGRRSNTARVTVEILICHLRRRVSIVHSSSLLPIEHLIYLTLGSKRTIPWIAPGDSRSQPVGAQKARKASPAGFERTTRRSVEDRASGSAISRRVSGNILTLCRCLADAVRASSCLDSTKRMHPWRRLLFIRKANSE